MPPWEVEALLLGAPYRSVGCRGAVKNAAAPSCLWRWMWEPCFPHAGWRVRRG